MEKAKIYLSEAMIDYINQSIHKGKKSIIIQGKGECKKSMEVRGDNRKFKGNDLKILINVVDNKIKTTSGTTGDELEVMNIERIKIK